MVFFPFHAEPRHWEIFKLYRTDLGLEGIEIMFMGEEDYHAEMDEFMGNHPEWEVFQIQDSVTGEVLTYIGNKDGKSVQWAVTTEGALADVVPGDNTGMYGRFIEITVKNPDNIFSSNRLSFNRGEDGFWYMAEVTHKNVEERWFIAPGGTEDNIESQWIEVEKKVEEIVEEVVEEKMELNYGYIAPTIWGEESLPLVREWWEDYKEKMPTNEDIKWLTYEDGSRVEMGEIPGMEYFTTKTFGVIMGEMFDFPDSIDENDYEQWLLTLLPTNPEKIEEAGNIIPVRLTTDPYHSESDVTLSIIGENGAIKESLSWNYVDNAYNMPFEDLLRFLKVGLSGENPPLYGCQLAVSLVGTNYGTEYLPGKPTKFVNSMFGKEGDGDWEVDYDRGDTAPIPQGAGAFYISESCMTPELREVFGTLPNNPVGGN